MNEELISMEPIERIIYYMNHPEEYKQSPYYHIPRPGLGEEYSFVNMVIGLIVNSNQLQDYIEEYGKEVGVSDIWELEDEIAERVEDGELSDMIGYECIYDDDFEDIVNSQEEEIIFAILNGFHIKPFSNLHEFKENMIYEMMYNGEYFDNIATTIRS